MKVGDLISGSDNNNKPFVDARVEAIYTDLMASGTNEYKEVTIVAFSEPARNGEQRNVRHTYVRNVSQIVEKEVEDFTATLMEVPEPKWEYHKLVSPLHEAWDEFARLGKEGWELVCETVQGFKDVDGLLRRVYIFKRIKKEG